MVTRNAADNATGASGTVLQGQGVGTASAFSTATYPATATSTGVILRADGTNWSATTATYPNTSTANQLLFSSATNTIGGLASANNGVLVTSNSGVPSVLAGSGTTGQVLQSNAAAAPSFSTATFPSTATSTGTILRADGTNWSATTATYPNTTTANQVLFSSATNTIGGLTSANNGLLVTSNAGVPSILAGSGTTGQVLQSNAAAAPSFSTATFPSTATSTGTILRADGTNWSATTATYPNTTTSQQILFSSAANTIGGLATGNSLLAATNSTGTLAMRAFSVNVQVFLNGGSTTYTPSTGMLYCTIECLGGGAGGGGCAGSSTTATSAGGGGAGSYSRKTVSAATIGASQTVTVGGTAAGGTSGNNNGTPGNDTSVGVICVGKGGSAGTGAAAGTAVAGGLGGVAGTGDFTPTGAPGLSGQAVSSGVTYTGLGGAGGSSIYGGGGRPPTALVATVAGNNATNYGSGGSGAAGHGANANAAGGSGSAGIVIITEYIIN